MFSSISTPGFISHSKHYCFVTLALISQRDGCSGKVNKYAYINKYKYKYDFMLLFKGFSNSMYFCPFISIIFVYFYWPMDFILLILDHHKFISVSGPCNISNIYLKFSSNIDILFQQYSIYQNIFYWGSPMCVQGGTPHP